MDAQTSSVHHGMTPELWELLADNLPQLAWVAQADGDIFWYNKRWFDYTGTTLDEMRGWGWKSVHHPDEVERVEVRFRAALASGEPWEDIFPLRGRDGHYRLFLSRAQPIRDSQGQISHWFGTNTDITEQRAAQDAARLSADRLSRAAAIANIFVWETDSATGVTNWGENAAEILRVGRDELPTGAGEGLFFVAEKDRQQLHDTFAKAAEQKKGEVALEFGGEDGRRWLAECRLTYDAAGRVQRVFGATRDITAEALQQRRKDFLLRLEERLRSVSDGAAARFAAATEIGRELGASRALYADVIDGKLEVAIRHEYLAEGAPSLAGTHPVPAPIFAHYQSGQPLVTHDIAVDPALAPARNEPEVAKLPIRAVLDVPLLRDGRLLAVLAIHDLSPRHWTDEEIALAVATAERTWDTVERARAEEQLRLSEAQAREAVSELEAVYATAPVGLTVLDRDLRYVRINDRLAEMNGISAADHIGRTVMEVVPDLAEQLKIAFTEVLGGKEVRGFEVSGETAAEPGRKRVWRENWLPVRDSKGEIVGMAVSAEDVTREKEAEERYRTIFNSAAVGISRVAPSGEFLDVNQRFCEIVGRRREEILGEGWRNLTHPEDVAADEALVRQVLAGEIDSYSLEKRYRGKGGEDIWVNLTVSTERNDDRSVRFFISVIEDIGERKRAEAALRASEERYRALFERMEQGFCIIQVEFDGEQPSDYRFTEVNPAFTRHTGLPPEVIGASIREAVPGLEQVWFDRYGAVARTGESTRFVDHAEPLDRWFEVYAFRIGDPAERNVAILFSDISERVRQEKVLRQSEQELRLRLNAIPQMVWSTTPDGYHDFYNDRWYEFTGTPLGSTDGEGWNGMFHPEDQSRALARWNESLTAGKPYEIEYRLRHHTGAYRWVLGRALPIRNEAGDVVRWMGTCTDIDDRIAAERALRASEAQLRAILEAVPVGLMFSDADGRLTGSNDQILHYLGHDLVPSSTVASYKQDYVAFNGDGRQVESDEYPLARALAGEDRPELECQVRRPDGTLHWLRYVAAPIRDEDGSINGGVVASIDIDRERRLTETLEREVEKVVAEREAAQEALRQSQKLEAMGQLTGGVAHDFNNLLTPIIGSLDLLHRKQVLDERTGRLVEGALVSAEKARVLVQRLLAFARRQPLKPQPIDLRRVITEMSELVDSTSGPRIRVVTDVPADLPPAMADGNQLEMALLNLSVNARDAMPEGGTLSIAARSERAGAARRLGLGDQPHVVLSVSDTGVGMDEQTLRRAIEPFFSTKGLGRGTGLGLSMVHGLAAQLGGALDIRSAPGMGTSIELWLPLANGAVDTSRDVGQDNEPHGAGTVLLVDDEELVRTSTSGMLADLGFRVVEADSGETALALVDRGLRPDLLVTDQLMPGLSGTDLAVQLRERIDGLPVLIVSGYADLESLSPTFPHLSKPFRQAELAAALDKVSA